MATSKAQREAVKRYQAKIKDRMATFSLRVKVEEKEKVAAAAAEAGKSITQYLMECAGIR